MEIIAIKDVVKTTLCVDMLSVLAFNGLVQILESVSLPVDIFSISEENAGRAGIIGERQQTLRLNEIFITRKRTK